MINESVLRAIVETRSWCARRLALDPGDPLRSEELRPSGYPRNWWGAVVHPDRIALLVEQRRSLLVGQAVEVIGRGRVLCAMDGMDTSMGEGIRESRGAIDDTYLPPWDTWFASIDVPQTRLLLAWIPPTLEPWISAAIAVAATEPIAWLDGSTDCAHWQQLVAPLAEIRRMLAPALR